MLQSTPAVCNLSATIKGTSALVEHSYKYLWGFEGLVRRNYGTIGATYAACMGKSSAVGLPPYCHSRPAYHLFESRRFGRGVSLAGGLIQSRVPTTKREDPNKPPSPLKSPEIPDGHPVDTDGRPLGHFIPDYDVEVPCLSFGGYTKDFETWTEPPVFPPTSWPKVAKYDYGELEEKNFPVMYELNMMYCINAFCLFAILVTVVYTKVDGYLYFKKNAEFYSSGWPRFHYSPRLDIVPLTARPDGLPPESPVLKFDDVLMVGHEMPRAEEKEESEE